MKIQKFLCGSAGWLFIYEFGQGEIRPVAETVLHAPAIPLPFMAAAGRVVARTIEAACGGQPGSWRGVGGNLPYPH
jgi:hypothetical protein